MRVFHDRPYVIADAILNTMGSMQHTFGVRELIRAGLQDLDKARELLQELQDNGVSDDRLQSLMATLDIPATPTWRYVISSISSKHCRAKAEGSTTL